MTSMARCLLLLLALCATAGGALAQDDCVKDRYGEPFCSQADGSVAADRTGEVVCGRGACVADINGEIHCSTAPRGAATLDRYGRAVCVEGCERGSKSLCVRPR